MITLSDRIERIREYQDILAHQISIMEQAKGAFHNFESTRLHGKLADQAEWLGERLGEAILKCTKDM